MNREDIIRMAREAGLVNWEATAYANELERFAKLVAQHEREACAKIAENTKAPFTATAIRARGQA
jgi:hypothetical protein